MDTALAVIPIILARDALGMDRDVTWQLEQVLREVETIGDIKGIPDVN